MELDELKNQILASYASNNLNIVVATTIVKQYLTEVEPDKVSLVDTINADLMNPVNQQLLSNLFMEARVHYERYFNLIKVFDKNGNFIHIYAPMTKSADVLDLKSNVK